MHYLLFNFAFFERGCLPGEIGLPSPPAFSMQFELKKTFPNNDLIVYDSVFDRFLVFLNDSFPSCLTSPPDYIFSSYSDSLQFIKDLYYPSLAIIRKFGNPPSSWSNDD